MLTPLLEKIALYSPGLFRLQKRYYEEIVGREIVLGSITEKDTVLCIGGGPLPCTALEIAKRTGAIVHVIDSDLGAVYSARKFVHKLNLSNQVKIFCAQGQTIDTSSYSVVHVALQAKPHDLILKNIWRKAKEGTRVLLRCPDISSFKSLFEQEKNPYCSACTLIEQKSATLKGTVLLQKGRENLEKNVAVYRGSGYSREPVLVGTYR
ncbi:class I SAM-dependent methyltransferase, putative [Heliorestis convoluta]|uniref:Class I SAM-dependent methyltransferase, putative n=2 Tax=Heliorestis convoluta TaxID=356322 RepID=A0A5Q2MWA6_9FIRM|nr:class I SAM-dependent methyltransferase, putative [Heliorestis convoluta]